MAKGPGKCKTMLGLSGVQIVELVEYKEQLMFDSLDGDTTNDKDEIDALFD